MPDAIESVEKQIRLEMELGRYITCDNIPFIVSSLGAIPKTEKRVRLIHDLSQPDGEPNRYAVDTSVCYATIDDAVRLIVPGSFLGKLDLSSAYRSVPIHPTCFPLTGLQWTFVGDSEPTYFYDARLPFGASMACSIFQGLSDAVVLFMTRRKFHVISYIDDFLCVEDSYERCLLCMEVLTELLVSLGFVINEQKREGPSEILTFLGVSIDCVRRTLSLPEAKLQDMRTLLSSWSGKVKCTKRELQKLLGSLNWCSRVVRGGQTFTRMLINLLTRASRPHHHIRLT